MIAVLSPEILLRMPSRTQQNYLLEVLQKPGNASLPVKQGFWLTPALWLTKWIGLNNLSLWFLLLAFMSPEILMRSPIMTQWTVSPRGSTAATFYPSACGKGGAWPLMCACLQVEVLGNLLLLPAAWCSVSWNSADHAKEGTAKNLLDAPQQPGKLSLLVKGCDARSLLCV